jgi:hypothetical protein
MIEGRNLLEADKKQKFMLAVTPENKGEFFL